ncbi:MAG: helix-turn-helix transcriptional regulator [Acidobacteriota bacterium]|nr:helix-turn-helix transcriptional regulator [Acidobacteriota bacterium]
MELTTSELVREWIDRADINASTAARRAGVSASTLHRILTDQVDPSIGTLREIAIGCGVDLSLTSGILSDWRAAATARSMFEEGYVVAKNDIADWESRLIRLAEGDHPIEIVSAAARASAPLHRDGATWCTGTMTVGTVASAGDASGGRWALSGAAGLYLSDTGEPTPAITILWCDDPRSVSQLLAASAVRTTDRIDRTTLAVVRGEPELFAGSFTKGLTRYAAPIQIIIDCLSLGGDVAKDAREEAMTW